MLTARDIMIPWVVTTTKETPVYKAIDLMLQHQISGLPVVELDMTVVGIITEKDILPLYNRTERNKSMTVEDFMNTSVISFDKDETLDDICACLIKNDFRRVPVVSSGKLVGIISRPDVTRRILQKIRQDPV